MEELHKLYVGVIVVMIVFMIMCGAVVEIQKINQVHLDKIGAPITHN